MNPPVTVEAVRPVTDQTAVLPPFDAALNPDPLEELDVQLRKASFFMQASLEKHGKLAQRLDAYVTGLLDVLIETGVIDAERLGEVVNRNREIQAEEQAEQLAENGGLSAWPLVIVREEKPDEPIEPDVPVDCGARMHICKAICCSLRFPLGPSEIESGKVSFEIGHPYVIRHSQQGYCVHNDRATGRCTVYENRPQVCQVYSCATDKRIWADFENMILNEEYLRERVPQRFSFHPNPDGAVPVSFTRRDGAMDSDRL
jgi:Fe-S-cluster containining protein